MKLHLQLVLALFLETLAEPKLHWGHPCQKAAEGFGVGVRSLQGKGGIVARPWHGQVAEARNPRLPPKPENELRSGSPC